MVAKKDKETGIDSSRIGGKGYAGAESWALDVQSKMKMMKGRKGDSKQGWISRRVGDDEVFPGWLGLDLSEVEALK